MDYDNLTTYQAYSMYFEGVPDDDEHMQELIEVGTCNESPPCYCFKVGNTYCCSALVGGKLKIISNLQYSEANSKYSMGRFVKKINFSVAKKGYNINNIVLVVWEASDIPDTLAEYNHTVCVLSKVLHGYNSLREFYHKVNYEATEDNNITARELVNLLSISTGALGLHVRDSQLRFGKTFIKDYTVFSYDFTSRKKVSYGVILDCEGYKGGTGRLDEGCSEIGGLIYVKAERKLFIVETFKAERNLIEQTLRQVNKRFTMLSGSRKIPTLVFGASDSQMLGACCSKTTLSNYKFNNCIGFINTHLGSGEGGNTSTLAGYCKNNNVLYKKPTHDPLNDAKTLFNILAYISEKFNEII